MSQVAARAEPTLRTTFAPLEEPRFVYTRDIPDGLFVVGFTGIGYPDGAELDSKKGPIILHASEGDGQIFVEDMSSFEWGCGETMGRAVEDWANSIRSTFRFYVLDKRRLSHGAKKLRRRLRERFTLTGVLSKSEPLLRRNLAS